MGMRSSLSLPSWKVISTQILFYFILEDLVFLTYSIATNGAAHILEDLNYEQLYIFKHYICIMEHYVVG
ncbi:Methylsterol monooxygenase 2-2 [Camellia lanceoleosa]|uniref:Methylsterol monooxygenase 2-2 n=1 Tax=Camellia lanceoleosa TaxID=1840588 RepID=A0ACC0IF35_9ERIC|nr:Methylsterol monooxygenase 2-2 [Camellia lanceoleosa]